MNAAINPFARAVLLLAAGLAAAPVAAQRVNAARSELTFVTRMMGVPVEGRFERWQAEVVFDPRQLATARVALRIDTASANFASPEVATEAQRAPWFDTARHAEARFDSTAVRSLGAGRYEVTGSLTLKGRSHPVTVPLTLAQSGSQGTATGTLMVRRLDFGIGEGEWADPSLVATDVQVRFRVALTDLLP